MQVSNVTILFLKKKKLFRIWIKFNQQQSAALSLRNGILKGSYRIEMTEMDHVEASKDNGKLFEPTIGQKYPHSQKVPTLKF